MNNSAITAHEILQSTRITHPFLFILLVIILTIGVRLILVFFKAKAIANGEVDSQDQVGEKKWGNENFKTIFSLSFWSNGKDIRIDDYWLPALIGVFELAVYPFLMVNGYWAAIGAWIAIKTASSWGADGRKQEPRIIDFYLAIYYL